MNNKLRFDHLEEILVELLLKEDRVTEEVIFLREIIVAQQLALTQMHATVNRLEQESTSMRQQLNELTEMMREGFAELLASEKRKEQILLNTLRICGSALAFSSEY